MPIDTTGSQLHRPVQPVGAGYVLSAGRYYMIAEFVIDLASACGVLTRCRADLNANFVDFITSSDYPHCLARKHFIPALD
jgi:hypothetical protein